MTLKQTPLFEQHKALGAKMVSFAGWQMPIEYSSILKEHQAVRLNMGLFDVSHMGEIEIRGKRALEFCQRVATNDASVLKSGKVQYSSILNEKGGILDDCTLYCLTEEHFLFVVNAASREKIVSWFQTHALDGAQVQDRSEDYALFALQGKKAEELLSNGIKRDLSTVRYYEFTWAEILKAAAIISRTGYTGEDGFEIYMPSKKAPEIWDFFLKQGEKKGLKPIGLGARDTLRLEMGYLLYGSDMNETVTPLEAGLSWIVKLDKGQFFGREALLKQKEEGVSRRLRGLKVKGRGIPRPHYEVWKGGEKVGEVTSGTFSPTLKKGIALAMVEKKVKLKDSVEVKIRNRTVEAEIVKPPFVQGSIKK